MKKLISIVLCIVSILSLSACGADKETEYERIQLTKDNCSDYININVYIDDYFFVVSEQTDTTQRYDISVVVHIETSKKIDCTFDDVSITYSPLYSTFWQCTYPPTLLPTTTLNLEGESHISYAAIRENSPSADVLTSTLTLTKGIIQSIEGFVVVAKENR